MLVRDYIKAATMIQRAWRKWICCERKRRQPRPADALFRNHTSRIGASTSPSRGADLSFHSPSWGDRLPGKLHSRTMRTPSKVGDYHAVHLFVSRRLLNKLADEAVDECDTVSQSFFHVMNSDLEIYTPITGALVPRAALQVADGEVR